MSIVLGRQHGYFLLIGACIRRFVREVDLPGTIRQLQERRFPAAVPEARSGLVNNLGLAPAFSPVGASGNGNSERGYFIPARAVITGGQPVPILKFNDLRIGHIYPDLFSLSVCAGMSAKCDNRITPCLAAVSTGDQFRAALCLVYRYGGTITQTFHTGISRVTKFPPATRSKPLYCGVVPFNAYLA